MPFDKIRANGKTPFITDFNGSTVEVKGWHVSEMMPNV